VKSSDRQVNMQRLGRGGATPRMGSTGMVSPYTASASSTMGSMTRPGHSASFDGSKSVSSVGSDDSSFQARNVPSTPALLHPRTQPQLWTLSMQFESDRLCIEAAQHMERRRGQLRADRCQYLSDLLTTWTDCDTEDPEAGFEEHWAQHH